MQRIQDLPRIKVTKKNNAKTNDLTDYLNQRDGDYCL
jgi:hypothetical protein